MVDFAKALSEFKAKGEFLGYCNYCDDLIGIHEIHILEAYKTAPDNEKKCKCPKCGKYQLVSNLIPF